MWEINRRMALTFNKRMGTKGHLWGARFKNIVVEPGENLLRVIAYIDANPQRAGIVDDPPSNFPYCSVGRVKEQLEQGEAGKAPDIPLFNRLAEEIRAKTPLSSAASITQAGPFVFRVMPSDSFQSHILVGDGLSQARQSWSLRDS